MRSDFIRCYGSVQYYQCSSRLSGSYGWYVFRVVRHNVLLQSMLHLTEIGGELTAASSRGHDHDCRTVEVSMELGNFNLRGFANEFALLFPKFKTLGVACFWIAGNNP